MIIWSEFYFVVMVAMQQYRFILKRSDWWFDSRQMQEISIISITSELALKSTQSPIQRISPALKRQQHEADHSFLYRIVELYLRSTHHASSWNV
jgi:hypothetical protein